MKNRTESLLRYKKASGLDITVTAGRLSEAISSQSFLTKGECLFQTKCPFKHAHKYLSNYILTTQYTKTHKIPVRHKRSSLDHNISPQVITVNITLFVHTTKYSYWNDSMLQ